MARSIDPNRIASELEAARDLLDRGDLDDAQAIIDQVLIAGPKGDDEREAYLLRGELQMELGRPRSAILAFDAAGAADTREQPAVTSDIFSGLGEAWFELWTFEKARECFQQALLSDKHNPRAHRGFALCLDRLGKRKVAEMHFARAHRIDPGAYPLPVRASREEFDRWTREAIESLPEEIVAKLGPISFLVMDYPHLAMLADEPDDADPQSLGVFFGEEFPERFAGASGGGQEVKFVANQIVIFQRNLEQMATTREELEEEVHTTVYHEVGHYLGYDEDQLDALGLA